jgi:hypothetical protein
MMHASFRRVIEWTGCLFFLGGLAAVALGAEPLRVGMAEADITPPLGFPMAGYYHERLATGTKDPLKAKAVVFRGPESQAALVVCDLTGIAVDLSTEVRRQAAEKTGIPAANIVVAATHSHTAPDYSKELYRFLAAKPDERASSTDPRQAYIAQLIAGAVQAIEQAHTAARPAVLQSGASRQETPVAFNRRFVMRDGSVQTWRNFNDPAVVRAAGPIDPQVALLAVRDAERDQPLGLLSNFALHLDTLGGMEWSADYPFFIERAVREALGPQSISLFGLGCCGDINHADPSRTERNKTDMIGNSLGATVRQGLPQLKTVERPTLQVRSAVVQAPLQPVTEPEVRRAVELLAAAKNGTKLEFFDHVTAYKQVMLDQLQHQPPFVTAPEHLSWGLSHTWQGVGSALPLEVNVITLGQDVAIVCLPGEVFVELGLAIKQASPFPNTLVIELSQCVETVYIPHRAAYAGGSYEVTNSTLQPGGGEMLVEAAVRLLREAAGATLQQHAAPAAE